VDAIRPDWQHRVRVAEIENDCNCNFISDVFRNFLLAFVFYRHHFYLCFIKSRLQLYKGTL